MVSGVSEYACFGTWCETHWRTGLHAATRRSRAVHYLHQVTLCIIILTIRLRMRPCKCTPSPAQPHVQGHSRCSRAVWLPRQAVNPASCCISCVYMLRSLTQQVARSGVHDGVGLHGGVAAAEWHARPVPGPGRDAGPQHAGELDLPGLLRGHEEPGSGGVQLQVRPC